MRCVKRKMLCSSEVVVLIRRLRVRDYDWSAATEPREAVPASCCATSLSVLSTFYTCRCSELASSHGRVERSEAARSTVFSS